MEQENQNHFIAGMTALAAGVGYGSWAIYANFEHSTHKWVMAGTIQGVYAFLSTLFITHIAHWVFLKYHCGIRGVLAGFLASFVVMVTIPLSVHNLLHTPDIWQTITPGLIWGSIYLLGFLFSLNVKSKP